MKNLNLKTLNKWDAVEIVWLDAFTASVPGWRTEEVLADGLGNMRITSIGYIFSMDENYINIVSCRSISDDVEVIVNRDMCIPIGCIESITKIKRM